MVATAARADRRCRAPEGGRRMPLAAPPAVRHVCRTVLDGHFDNPAAHAALGVGIGRHPRAIEKFASALRSSSPGTGSLNGYLMTLADDLERA